MTTIEETRFIASKAGITIPDADHVRNIATIAAGASGMTTAENQLSAGQVSTWAVEIYQRILMDLSRSY